MEFYLHEKKKKMKNESNKNIHTQTHTQTQREIIKYFLKQITRSIYLRCNFIDLV